MQPRIAIYIRKSDTPQDEQRQHSNIGTFLAGKGWTVQTDDIYSDAESRHKAEKRKQFQELLSAVEQRKYDMVIVSEGNRWGIKDVDEFFEFRRILQKAKCVLWSVKDGDLTATDMATIIRCVVDADASKAQQKNMSYQIQSKKNRLAKEGTHLGGTCRYGYDKICCNGDKLQWTIFQETRRKRIQQFPDGKQVIWTDSKVRPQRMPGDHFKFVLSQDQKRVDCIRLMFHLYTDQGLSLHKVAKRLNQAGYSIYGVPFNEHQVRLILRNRWYAGYYFYGDKLAADFYRLDGTEITEADTKTYQPDDKMVIIPDHHPAIVTKEQFAKAQEMMKGRKKNGYAPRDPSLWLKNFLYCGHCGKRMRARIAKQFKTPQPYYHCASDREAKQKGLPSTCKANWIKGSVVEELIMERFADLRARFARQTIDETCFSVISFLEGVRQQSAIVDQQQAFFQNRVAAWVEHLADKFKVAAKGTTPLDRLRSLVQALGKRKVKPEAIGQAIRALELNIAQQAQLDVARLTQEHKSMTRAWALAIDDPRRQASLNDALHDLDQELTARQEEVTPFWERLSRFDQEAQDADCKIAHALDSMGEDGNRKAVILAELLTRIELRFKKAANNRNNRTVIDKEATVWVSPCALLDTSIIGSMQKSQGLFALFHSVFAQNN